MPDPDTTEGRYIEGPEGPTGTVPDTGKVGLYRTRDRSLERTTRAAAPMLLTEEHNPISILSEMFDLVIAANTVLTEAFNFAEIPQTYIDLFRNDPDPKVRMAAGDRLLKYFRDCLVASGAVAKATETFQIRSADGTTAERSVVTRRLMHAFQEEMPNVRRVEPENIPADPNAVSDTDLTPDLLKALGAGEGGDTDKAGEGEGDAPAHPSVAPVDRAADRGGGEDPPRVAGPDDAPNDAAGGAGTGDAVDR